MKTESLRAQIAKLKVEQDRTLDPILWYELELEIDALIELLAGDGK